MDTLDKIISDIRDRADYCHNNQSGRTCEHWERMSKTLLGFADRLTALKQGAPMKPVQFA